MTVLPGVRTAQDADHAGRPIPGGRPKPSSRRRSATSAAVRCSSNASSGCACRSRRVATTSAATSAGTTWIERAARQTAQPAAGMVGRRPPDRDLRDEFGDAARSCRAARSRSVASASWRALLVVDDPRYQGCTSAVVNATTPIRWSDAIEVAAFLARHVVVHDDRDLGDRSLGDGARTGLGDQQVGRPHQLGDVVAEANTVIGVASDGTSSWVLAQGGVAAGHTTRWKSAPWPGPGWLAGAYRRLRARHRRGAIVPSTRVPGSCGSRRGARTSSKRGWIGCLADAATPAGRRALDRTLVDLTSRDHRGRLGAASLRGRGRGR